MGCPPLSSLLSFEEQSLTEIGTCVFESMAASQRAPEIILHSLLSVQSYRSVWDAPGSWMGPDRPSFACEQELLNTGPSLPPLYLDPCEFSFPLFLYLLFCLRGSCYVAQVGLNPSILLPQPLGCWNSRHETLHPA